MGWGVPSTGQPAAGADVMATGIVSTGLSLDGQETLSKITLGIAAVIWVALAILLPLRAGATLRASGPMRAVRALTGSVATAVLGTRLVLLGWAWAGIVALLIALHLWNANGHYLTLPPLPVGDAAVSGSACPFGVA